MFRFTSYLWLDIIIYILISFLVMIAYNLTQIFYLKNVKPNKYVLLATTILVVLLSSFLSVKFNIPWISLIGVILAIYLMLWTFERFRDKKGNLKKNTKGKVEKEIINRPKAKPNRVKKDK